MNSKYDYKKYAVLYVDDEETALKYFRKAMEKEFTVLTATNVAEANLILDQKGSQIGVLITDQKMPGALGVELLKRCRNQWPNMTRLLITAFSELESAIEAVNRGAIFKYITKPADLKELKLTITAAMELFLSQGEKDTLLQERLAVIQRMIVADRVRGLAAMAGGISHHLRNSMTALSCFLEETEPPANGEPAAPSDPKLLQQLWTLAFKERERLLDIINRVAQTVEPRKNLAVAESDAAALVKQAAQDAGTVANGRTIDTAGAAPAKLNVSPADVAGALKTLVTYVARLSQPTEPIVVSSESAQIANVPAIRFRVRGGAKPWNEQDVTAFFTPFAFPASDPSDLGVELLGAFSVAYQHGGDIIINRAAPEGPGFDLLLPVDPTTVTRPELQEGLLERLFTHFEAPATPAAVPAPKAA